MAAFFFFACSTAALRYCDIKSEIANRIVLMKICIFIFQKKTVSVCSINYFCLVLLLQVAVALGLLKKYIMLCAISTVISVFLVEVITAYINSPDMSKLLFREKVF